MKAVSSQRSVVSKGVLCIALCIMLLALCTPAQAQQSSKVPKVGILRARLAASGTLFDGLLHELRALGYTEGKNISLESRLAENRPERLRALVDELVQLKVDVIVTAAGSETLVVKGATRSIPIVGLNLGNDPVESGIVESFARPGGNVTGFSTRRADLVGKRLELLKETLPKLSRVAVLWNPNEPGTPSQWKESELAAPKLGLRLHSMEVRSPDKFLSAFEAATKARSTALSVTTGPFISSHRKQISELALKYRLPAIYAREDYVDIGGLMSYAHDQNEANKRVAVMIDKILKGIKPSDIPVERPTKFEFVINLKTAKQIGLTIPPNVVARADRVIR
jgi:putative ABC transport system substrate-binding protein